MTTPVDVGDLLRRVQIIERHLGIQPATVPTQPIPPVPIVPDFRRCSKCRIDSSGFMGYVCPRGDCPYRSLASSAS